MKYDGIDDFVVNGMQKPIFPGFVLDKPPGFKVFCQPETILYRKKYKSVMNTIIFYIENDDHEEVNFNEETLFFTL